MTESEEQAYLQGGRYARVMMLNRLLVELGYDDPEVKKAGWITEREDAIHSLRSLCAKFGDNNWPENLHLADIIEKHLVDHLHKKESGDE